LTTLRAPRERFTSIARGDPACRQERPSPAFDGESHARRAQPVDQSVAHRGSGCEHAVARLELVAIESETERGFAQHLGGLPVARIALALDARSGLEWYRAAPVALPDDADAEEAGVAL